ncbi:hypothetical protein BC940DRAFT_301071 [Gongronella butleri]|nr:hypothetical protein BC940DRAFT_301071 [Gongronella butleri]
MPFRCKCGRTFEKPDSFATHTSACASFHSRRVSDATASISIPRQQQQQHQASQPTMSPPTAPLTIPQSLPTLSSLSFFQSKSPPTSPTDQMSTSPLGPSFMPTGLSIQDELRRRSMSSGSGSTSFK